MDRAPKTLSRKGCPDLARSQRRSNDFGFRISDFGFSFSSGSAHFQLFSQDEVQQDKQYECGQDQHYRVESEHAERDSEIAFFKTEEHVRLIAAAIVVLLHLGS